MSDLSCPPLGGSWRSRNQSWDVSWSQRGSCLSLGSLGNGDMVDITEGIVGAGQLDRCCYRSLSSPSRGLQTLLVDLVIGGQQSVVTVRVG